MPLSKHFLSKTQNLTVKISHIGGDLMANLTLFGAVSHPLENVQLSNCPLKNCTFMTHPKLF